MEGNPLSLCADSHDDPDFSSFLDDDEDDNGEEAKPDEPGPSKTGVAAKCKAATGKAKAKASAVKKRHLKGKDKNDHGWKKCKTCKAWKEPDDFNENQGSCKCCFNDGRSLRRLAERQKMKDDLSTMEKDDPHQYSALMKSFAKERAAAKKAGGNIKFSINAFKLTYRSRSGVRAEQVGEMMWEQEWYEESQRAKYGYLTRSEAEKQWNEWLSNPKHPRDKLGPRGWVRLWVKTSDKLTKFDEVDKSKEFSKQEQLGKKPTDAAIANRLKFLAGADMDEHNIKDGDLMLDKAAHDMLAAESGSKDSIFREGGLLAPDVEGMVAKTKKRTVLCKFRLC